MTQHFRPPVPRPIVIEGPAGSIEGRLEDPAGDRQPDVVGVVCHPHPLHGGTMQNKVVHTLARAMHELGTPTVRFNFRGVGGSAGAYADGEGEQQDALAVVAWARRRWRSERLWLAGFSFGAAVALHAAGTARPERLVTVAPPVSRLQAIPASRPGCSWLVVHGDRDELVPVAAVEAWVTGFEPPPELQILAGAEHFFHGRLGDLREVVRGFLAGPVND
jgi:alpha/beta superfamily hydrolase